MQACTRSQRTLRANVHDDAEVFIRRAPREGYPRTIRSFPVRGPRVREKNARIDLEIQTGLAFKNDDV